MWNVCSRGSVSLPLDALAKAGGDHRSEFCRITLPAFPGKKIGVGITLGCADPHAEPTEFPGKAPFVLSVTRKRTGFAQLRFVRASHIVMRVPVWLRTRRGLWFPWEFGLRCRRF
jgi:hypothetical protein